VRVTLVLDIESSVEMLLSGAVCSSAPRVAGVPSACKGPAVVSAAGRPNRESTDIHPDTNYAQDRVYENTLGEAILRILPDTRLVGACCV